MSQNEVLAGKPALITKLTVECGAWQALLNVLAQEEQALVNGEADLLPKLNALKMAQLQTLNTLVRTRHDDLLVAGHSPDHSGMDAWLAQQNKPEHTAPWETLQSMEQQAQAMNQRIGVLIELRLSSTRQALNVLVQAAKSQGGMYDQAGCAVTSNRGKPLTAA